MDASVIIRKSRVLTIPLGLHSNSKVYAGFNGMVIRIKSTTSFNIFFHLFISVEYTAFIFYFLIYCASTCFFLVLSVLQVSKCSTVTSILCHRWSEFTVLFFENKLCFWKFTPVRWILFIFSFVTSAIFFSFLCCVNALRVISLSSVFVYIF